MLTHPAIMVLTWPSLTYTGSTENRETAGAFVPKHSNNARAEQHYRLPFLIVNTQYLEVPLEYYTIPEKPRFTLPFWTRSNLSNITQEAHQCDISVHSVSHPVDYDDYFFSMPCKLERLKKKTLLMPQTSLWLKGSWRGGEWNPHLQWKGLMALV